MNRLSEFFAFVFACAIMFAMGFGWIWNIVKLCTYHESFGKIMARAACIFIWPIGAILGYF